MRLIAEIDGKIASRMDSITIQFGVPPLPDFKRSNFSNSGISDSWFVITKKHDVDVSKFKSFSSARSDSIGAYNEGYFEI